MLGKFSIFSSRSYNYKDNGMIFTDPALSRATVGANDLPAARKRPCRLQCDFAIAAVVVVVLLGLSLFS
jgi:hypothetical protein